MKQGTRYLPKKMSVFGKHAVAVVKSLHKKVMRQYQTAVVAISFGDSENPDCYPHVS